MKAHRILKIVAAVITALICIFAVAVFIEKIDALTIRIASEIVDGKPILKTERVLCAGIILPIISIAVFIATAVLSVVRIFTVRTGFDFVCGLFPIISSALISFQKLDMEAMAFLRDRFHMGIKQAYSAAPSFLIAAALILITLEATVVVTRIIIKKRQK